MTPPADVVAITTQTTASNTAHTSNLAKVPSPDKEDTLEDQPLYCGADYHILKDATPFALAIYNRACALSHESRKFFTSVETIAEFFDKNESTVTRSYQSLVDVGYFKVEEIRPFASTIYRVLNHEEWAVQHPNKCRPKFKFVWAGEGDKLAQTLFAVTGGWVKLFENQMVSLRKIMTAAGLTDTELVRIFDGYYQVDGKKHRNPKNVIPVFINWLKKQHPPRPENGQLSEAS